MLSITTGENSISSTCAWLLMFVFTAAYLCNKFLLISYTLIDFLTTSAKTVSAIYFKCSICTFSLTVLTSDWNPQRQICTRSSA